MKALSKAIVAAFGAATCAISAFASISATSGDIVPGVWNDDFAKGKAYADANNVPMVVFYGKADCGNCRSLKSHLDSETAHKWFAEKGYVLILSTKFSSPHWEDARLFCLSAYDSTKLPMISVYWSKEDGKTIHKGFTGTSSGMMGVGGMDVKFINTVETILGTQGSSTGGGSSAGGNTPSGDTNTIPTLFTKARKLSGVVLDADGDFVGVITVATGKASKKTRKAKVRATVELLGMSKKSFASKTFDVTATKEFPLTSAFGTLALTFDETTFTGTLDCSAGELVVMGATVGGAMPTSTSYVSLDGEWTTYKNSPVFTEWLPFNQSFTSSATRWTFAKAGKVKYNKTLKAFENTSAANPSGIKLTYKPSTGYFKGTFNLQFLKSETKAAKIRAKVVGYVYGGVGYGIATATGLGALEVAITSEPLSVCEDCED